MTTAATTLTACRVCGVATDQNVEVREGRTPAGHRDASSDYSVGTCATCQTLDTITPGAAVRACLRLLGKDEAVWPAFSKVLEDREIDAAAVLFEVTGNPRRGAQRTAFHHVPREVKAELRRGWAAVLEARVDASLPPLAPTPTGPPEGSPPACLSCGAATAVEWHGPLHTFGLMRGPDPVEGYVCPDCAVSLEAVGAVGQPFVERAVMQAKGLDRTPRVRAWVATGLPPQDTPWGWVDTAESAITLDPWTAMMEAVAVLTERVDGLERRLDG